MFINQNKENGMKYVFITLCLAFAVPSPSWAYSAYVQSIRADVYTQPSIGSKKVTSLSKGDMLNVMTEQGPFYKVETGNQTGYVYKLLLGNTPVSGSAKLYSRLQSFFGRIETITEKSRRRPSSYTATAAARGLREKREHFAKLYKSDYESLERFEAIAISDEEALDFLKKGVADETDR
jgi:hypothetical protein